MIGDVALLVVSFSSAPVLWLLPTALGAPALHRLSHMAGLSHRGE